MEQIWKSLKNFEGLYLISDHGVVKSMIKVGNRREAVRKSSIDISTGYVNIQLYKDGKPLTKRIHRLMAQTFLSNPLNLPVVNHKDGNKRNNMLGNLEWTTYSKNTLHSFALNLQKKFFGDDNYITKISNLQVEEIRNLLTLKKKNKEIALIYNVNPSQISRIRSGKRRSKVPSDDIC